MPSGRRRDLGSLIALVAGTLGSQALTAISGILSARMLGVEGRGHVALVMALSALASQLTLGSSLPVGIATQLARRGVSARDGLRRLFPRWCVWALLPATAAGVYLMLVVPDATSRTRWFLAVLVAVAALQAMAFRIVIGAMQGELASVRRMAVAALLAPALSTGLLIVAFARDWDWDAVDLLTAQAAMWTIGLLLSTRLLRRPEGKEPLHGGDVWKVARTNYVNAIGPIDGLALDRTLIGSLMSSAALGIYAAATAFANVSSMVGSAVGVILLPRVSAEVSQQGRLRLVRRWVGLAAALITVVVVSLVLVIEPLILLAFGQPFASAAGVAAWLVVADGALGLRRVLIAALQGTGNGGRASVVELALLPLVVIGIVVAATRGSLVGVAVTLLLAAVTSCLLLGLLVLGALRTTTPVTVGSRVLLVELGGQGHRFYPVRLLTEEALARGASVAVLTRVDATTREHLEVHLGELLDRIDVIELERPGWADVERTARDLVPDLTVVTEADHYLMRLMSRGGWRAPGRLSLLVMRARVPSVGTPLRSAVANVIKAVTVTVHQLMPRVRVRVLRSQMWNRRSIWAPVNDPATLDCTLEDVQALRAQWQLDDDRYWIGVLGAVTENKNLPLVVDAVASIARDHPVGLLVAGRVSPSIQPDLEGMQRKLSDAGARVVLHDRLLTEQELDAAVAAIDCMALAYSHNGPSGTFGKALLAGTRVVGAGSPALLRDCRAAPGLSAWVPLTVDAVAGALREAMAAPDPAPIPVPGSKEFTTALLGPPADEHRTTPEGVGT